MDKKRGRPKGSKNHKFAERIGDQTYTGCCPNTFFELLLTNLPYVSTITY